MDQDSMIIPLLRQEEGVRNRPYIDSLGYPTAGVGFKLGPQGVPLSHYTFSLDDRTIDAWLNACITAVQAGMKRSSSIAAAMSHCNPARQDVLTSMAYQTGVSGLEKFRNMLTAIIADDWNTAANEMLDSIWAKQTAERACRHATVMRTGVWKGVYHFDVSYDCR
ncbi:glycoside hydrolase family protein [Enterobacter sp. 22452]|uniref:glycoside hydrolase family protein n=1 Tax=Enterobacter TaxID=547 RepID=UPI003F86AAE0